jgi:hypothetical protein
VAWRDPRLWRHRELHLADGGPRCSLRRLCARASLRFVELDIDGLAALPADAARRAIRCSVCRARRRLGSGPLCSC